MCPQYSPQMRFLTPSLCQHCAAQDIGEEKDAEGLEKVSRETGGDERRGGERED